MKITELSDSELCHEYLRRITAMLSVHNEMHRRGIRCEDVELIDLIRSDDPLGLVREKVTLISKINFLKNISLTTDQAGVHDD